MVGVLKVRPPCYLEKVEDAIITALKENISGAVKVEAFPAKPDDYDFAGLEAAILVHYSGSQFKAREGVFDTSQDRRFNFSIVLLTRSMRGHSGSYEVLEDIRQCLQGEVFEGAGPIEIVSDALSDESEGVWRWEIVIALNAPAIARNKQSPAPLMRPSTLQSNN